MPGHGVGCGQVRWHEVTRRLLSFDGDAVHRLPWERLPPKGYRAVRAELSGRYGAPRAGERHGLPGVCRQCVHRDERGVPGQDDGAVAELDPGVDAQVAEVAPAEALRFVLAAAWRRSGVGGGSRGVFAVAGAGCRVAKSSSCPCELNRLPAVGRSAADRPGESRGPGTRGRDERGDRSPATGAIPRSADAVGPAHATVRVIFTKLRHSCNRWPDSLV